MRRPARVDVNDRAEFRETPRGPRVIEMNVTEKNVADVLGGETLFVELLGHVSEGRLRSGIEEDEASVSFDGCRRNNASPAKLLCVENMDAHYRDC
jgi:hypothetical protein